MRARCQVELEVTIAHLQAFIRQAEVVNIGLLELIGQMEDALCTLKEGLEPLNNPAYHIQLLRQIRRHHPLNDKHDSGHSEDEELFPVASDDAGNLRCAEAALERVEEEAGKAKIFSFQGHQTTVKDAHSLGKLVELDRYRDQVMEGFSGSGHGCMEATGSHRLHEVAPEAPKRQHHVDKKDEDFQSTAADGTSAGELDGAYVNLLGFVAGHLPQVQRETVEFFAAMIRSELYGLPGCS